MSDVFYIGQLVMFKITYQVSTGLGLKGERSGENGEQERRL